MVNFYITTCAIMGEVISLVLLGLLLPASGDPLVTLLHGGQLQGVQANMGDQVVDQFLGIPFARPPLGDLRFRKPQPADTWAGIKIADKLGSSCLQLGVDGRSISGSEDCLYLNIYLPGKVPFNLSGQLKSVMVWIHGGSYVADSAAAYMGSALALHGDVIVVAMNYRLGLFGFFHSGPGTGNYGLWDQRQAIIWVKENIAAFGGDPKSITIFGESSGGGSVAAQMMGQHNDGLFLRGIAQSGALYAPWSWYTNYDRLTEITTLIRDSTGCGPDSDICRCLKKLSGEEILKKAPIGMVEVLWTPVADDDFFATDVDEENYALAQRFDMMAGFNGQEGSGYLLYIIFPAIAARNESVDEGCSMEMAQEFLQSFCTESFTTQAPELCVDSIIRLYELDKAANGRERAIKLSIMMGEHNFNADMVDMMEKHSEGSKKTYSYYFTKKSGLTMRPGGVHIPEWSIISADHAEELPVVFGMSDVPDGIIDSMKGSGFNHELVFSIMVEMQKLNSKDHQHFSHQVMSMWTNFAKTGDPNLPSKWAEDSTPVWPQFTVAGQKFLELGDELTVIQTPNKERLRKFREVLKPALRRKYIDAKNRLDKTYQNASDLRQKTADKHEDL